VADHKGNAAYVTPNSALVTAGPGHKIKDSEAAAKVVHNVILRNRLIFLGVALGLGGLAWHAGGRDFLWARIHQEQAKADQEQAKADRERKLLPMVLASRQAQVDREQAEAKMAVTKINNELAKAK